MLFPHVRHNQVNHTVRLQHAPKFFDGAAGLRYMLQHYNREDMVEREIGKRQFLEPANYLQVRVVPRRIALREVDPHVFRVCKK